MRAFLLVEEPGPWGVEAWRDARLPEGLGAQVVRRSAAAGVRPLLIRRPGVRAPVAGGGVVNSRRVFAVVVDERGGRVQATDIGDPRELLDLDLDSLGRGEPLALSPWPEPVFAVCTHGRHDACCAERGRPAALALAALEPEATWAVSHIGGDRFAANLLVLGEGLYYGGLDRDSVCEVVAAHRSGLLDLARLRGRSCWPMPVQAAEIGLRRRLGDAARGSVRLVGRRRVETGVEVTFGVHDQRWNVLVTEQQCPPERLTCQAPRALASTVWRVSSIHPVERTAGDRG